MGGRKLFGIRIGLIVFAGVWISLECAAQETKPLLNEPPRFLESGTPTQAYAVLPPAALDSTAAEESLTVYPKNRKNSVAFFERYYAGAAESAIGWTGDADSCDAGDTAADFRAAVELRLNYFRAMGGVPARVRLGETNRPKAQDMALMISVNRALSHYPPSDWTCYTPDGYEAAGNSNIAYGAYGSRAMDLYMEDWGDSNGAVGHRRWILYPQTEVMATGDIASAGILSSNDLWVFDGNIWEPRPPTRDTFVAWPPPGYVPYSVVYPRWSFSYPSADLSQASVRMTLNQLSVPVELEVVHNGYGENTLVWIPNGMASADLWPVPASDTRYRVTIDNVRIEGAGHSFSYEVAVIDPGRFVRTDTRDLGDFDGDGRTDLTVWRPANGIWFTQNSATGDYSMNQWGVDSDIAVPGDYDGDGVADHAVWRPSSGIWYIRMSGSPGSYSTIQWGAPSDRPVPSDYDGDLKTDIAVWRPDTGIWYVRPSGDPANPATTQWGMSTDTPVPSDYDGDGKTDIAVWRPDTGIWYVRPSGAPGSYASTQWGAATDVPVPADYDRDGESDLAVWRPGTGIWYLLPSDSEPGVYSGIQWGLSGDTPVPADYDGDGAADLAVWRPDSGYWFILTSAVPGSYAATQWGISGDLAISPNMRVLP